MPVAMRDTSCSAIADRFGGVVVLEVHGHDVAAAAFHQRPGGGLVEGCRDEVVTTLRGRREKALQRVRRGFRVLPLQRSFLELLLVAHTDRYPV